MKKNSICFFAPNLKGGGAERVISILANLSDNSNYDITIILAHAEGPYLKDINSSINIIDLKLEKISHTLQYLIRFLRSNKPDILFSSHIHSSIIAIWAVKLARVTTHTIIRQPTMLKPTLHKKETLKSKVVNKIFCKTIALADTIVVTNKAMYDEFLLLTNINSQKIHIIPNPVPIDRIKDKSLEMVDHPWLQENKKIPVILSAGRLVEVKDFKTLLRAIKQLNRTTRARLIILGEGPLKDELKSYINQLNIEHLVDMPGFKTNPYSYMKNADVYVMSSLWEGFPNSLIESMACGTTVVSTDCEGGAAEILDFGQYGALVPVGNHIEMAGAILDSLSKSNTSRASAYIERFSERKVFNMYKTLFDKV